MSPSSVSTDTSRTIEIEASPGKLLLVAVGSLIFVIFGLAMALGSVHAKYPDIVVRLIGWFAVAFFGLCFVVALSRLFTQHGPVVTISRDGIRDTRIVAEFIPWRAIQRISTWQYKRQKTMVLAVDPAVERTLTLTLTARWTRGANSALGANGLCISASGLKITSDELLATTAAYWQARRPA